jgi:hypothetical protein
MLQPQLLDTRISVLIPNEITTTDVSASNKYDDSTRGPRLILEVQESLYNVL